LRHYLNCGYLADPILSKDLTICSMVTYLSSLPCFSIRNLNYIKVTNKVVLKAWNANLLINLCLLTLMKPNSSLTQFLISNIREQCWIIGL
jgi:hypothetical protein